MSVYPRCALIIFAAFSAFAHSASAAEPAATPAPKMKAAATVWTIGFYAGPSPFELKPAPGAANPVIVPGDLGDPEIDTVAHPFLAVEGSRYYAFFTAKNIKTGKGGIGLAESADGLKWTSRGLVLRTDAVLSYPFTFQWQGTYYMAPESSDNVVRLYRATRFPDQWTLEAEILKGEKIIDPTFLHHANHWYLFVATSNSTARLYHSDKLTGPYTEHPRSPIVANDANIARPSGRPLLIRKPQATGQTEGPEPVEGLYRLAQDCEPTYGNRVVALEIVQLTPTEYREQLIDKSLISATGSGWNSAAMHHVDAHRLGDGKWIALVDARGPAVKR